MATGLAALCAISAASPASAQLQKIETDDGFAVLMPGTPETIRNDVKIPAGTVGTAAWTVTTDGGEIYSVSFADYPEQVGGTPESFLAESRAGLVNQLRGIVVSESPLMLQGNPGKAFVIASDNGEVKARAYMVGRRLYTMLVLYNPSVGAKDADGFLNSLEIKGK